jgi:uncharacterized protein YjiS (DUF1127 family)
MSAHTANTEFSFRLPSLSYVDAKWEEPNLRVGAPVEVRKPGLAGWLARRFAAFNAWRRDAIAAEELAVMSDRELIDIGLTRSDMNRVFEPAFNEDLRSRGV